MEPVLRGYVVVEVEVGEAAAGTGVLPRPAVDSRALIGEAFAEEVEVKKVHGPVAVEVPGLT